MMETKGYRENIRGIAEEKWRKDIPPGLEHGLRNYWYPLALSAEVLADKPFALTALCEDLTVWRDSSGRPHIFVDSCPHRAVKLSAGCVLGDRLQCAYHGLEFDGSGQCLFIPWEGDDPEKCKVLRARGYPAAEVGGLIWGYIGDIEQFPPPPVEEILPLEMQREDFVHYERRMEPWDVNWLLAWDGSFDPQHNAFIHADGVTVKLHGGRKGGIYRMSARDLANGVKLQRLGPDGKLQGDLAGGWMVPGVATLVPIFEHGPAVLRSWRYPLDVNRTHVIRSWSRIARSSEERKFWEHLFYTRVFPDSMKIDLQDRNILLTQRGLAHARSNEQLLNCDVGIVRMRRLLHDTFVAQQEGQRLQSSPWSPLLSDPWVGYVDDPRLTAGTEAGAVGT